MLKIFTLAISLYFIVNFGTDYVAKVYGNDTAYDFFHIGKSLSWLIFSIYTFFSFKNPLTFFWMLFCVSHSYTELFLQGADTLLDKILTILWFISIPINNWINKIIKKYTLLIKRNLLNVFTSRKSGR